MILLENKYKWKAMRLFCWEPVSVSPAHKTILNLYEIGLIRIIVFLLQTFISSPLFLPEVPSHHKFLQNKSLNFCEQLQKFKFFPESNNDYFLLLCMRIPCFLYINIKQHMKGMKCAVKTFSYIIWLLTQSAKINQFLNLNFFMEYFSIVNMTISWKKLK